MVVAPNRRDVETDTFTARDYQVELVDIALKRNTIVQLATGSGKTMIAILLIKEFADTLYGDFKEGKAKRAFFLADKIALVEQQAEQIKTHTTLSVGLLVGSKTGYIDTKHSADKYFSDNQVIVCTPQILCNFIDQGFIDKRRISLLIFDECHHALGFNHPYRNIMNAIRESYTENQPRILGLTASLICDRADLKKLEAQILKLEDILMSTVAAISDILMTIGFGSNAKEIILATEPFKASWLRKIIEDSKVTMHDVTIGALENLKKKLEKIKFGFAGLENDPRKSIFEAIDRIILTFWKCGPFCALKVAQLYEKEHQRMAKQAYLTERTRDLYEIALVTFSKFITYMSFRPKYTAASFALSLPPKIRQFLSILQQFAPNNGIVEEFRGIVLVEERVVAYALKMLIRYIAELASSPFGYLKVDFVVGASGSLDGDNTDSPAVLKRQTETVRKFHRGELNLLIATNVLEEGIDVRQCNVVIKFDPPKTFRSYVQSKGRARAANSIYFIFSEPGHGGACMAQIEKFKQIEKYLLKRKPEDRSTDEPMPNLEQMLPEYTVESTGATIKMTNAISRINRYCSSLPSDIFSRLFPDCPITEVLVDGVLKYTAELFLPMNSPVKRGIKSDKPYSSRKLAEMSAAFEACKVLHKEKELTDFLLPQARDNIVRMWQMEDDIDEVIPGEAARAGSSKRKQVYEKKVASALHGPSIIQRDIMLQLYVINLKPMEIESNAKCELYNFGFLSVNTLPTVPNFHLFLRPGDTLVSIKCVAQNLVLSLEQVQQCLLFHRYWFKNVLYLEKEGVVDFADGESTPMNLIIVPVRENQNIDFDLCAKLQSAENIFTQPSDELRQQYKFSRDRYKDAIVVPWYRKGHSFFEVGSIIDGLQPGSKFPDENYETFNDYFHKKYTLNIFDQNQNLLDVNYTSNRLNVLLPRTKSKKPVRTADPSQRQIFVPELMNMHPMPAHLFNKACALPSIFYRLNHLLLLDELRKRICKEALNIEEPRTPDTWPELNYADRRATTVTKIRQLYDDNQKSDVEASSIDVENIENNFEIGVWDPSLADTLIEPQAPVERPEEREADAAAIVNDAPQLSDEEEMDSLKLFEFSSDFAKKYKDDSDFAAPRQELLPQSATDKDYYSNWDMPFEQPEDPSFFQVLSVGSNNFDKKNLAADLAKSVFSGPITPLESPMDSDQQKPRPKSPNSVLSVDLTPPKCSKDSSNNNIQQTLFSWGIPKTVKEIVKIFEDWVKMLNTTIRASSKESQVDSPGTVDLTAMGSDFTVPACAQPQSTDSIDVKEQSWIEHVLTSSSTSNMSVSEVPESTLPMYNVAKKRKAFKPSANLAPRLLSSEYLPIELLELLPPTSLTDFGVNPAVLLQAVTTCSAADGFNLERLETMGDSFLKFAVTDYMYHKHTDQHEGKLSFARSKEVSNFNLYRLGKRAGLHTLIVGSKFEVQEAWVPPGYRVSVDDSSFMARSEAEDDEERKLEEALEGNDVKQLAQNDTGVEVTNFAKTKTADPALESKFNCNPLTQQIVSDKTIADSVEALIGAHLLHVGINQTLKVMEWLGLKVLTTPPDIVNPLLRFIDTEADPYCSQKMLLHYYDKYRLQHVEERIGYTFKNKAYLLQSFTHVSFYHNRVTGCYQRLEFLGDAVLDFLITHYLFHYENKKYSPGVLTDLRSALVNNTIFASLAVKYDFHKHFAALCPGLHEMIGRFVNLCKEKNFIDANFNAEMYMITTEEEVLDAQDEDVEVPKAMSDLFESLAGAIYLDSGRDLAAVWQVYYGLMKHTILECCKNPPRSPIRELLEREPQNVGFNKMERMFAAGKSRITVVVNKGGRALCFTGVGRNYRIAKSTAAKRALKYLYALEKEQREKPEKPTTSNTTLPPIATNSVNSTSSSTI